MFKIYPIPLGMKLTLWLLFFLPCFNKDLAHNEFTGPLPFELQDLTRMEYMVINYNQFDDLFPIATAPTLMGVCLVQPNEFSACPPNSSVETSTTLAYRCNLDFRGIKLFLSFVWLT